MRTAIAVAIITLARSITPAAIAQTSSTCDQFAAGAHEVLQRGSRQGEAHGRRPEDVHVEFMSNCLSGKTTTASKNSQQEKMKMCNTQASSQKLTGDARKSFMSSCLKGS